MDDPRQNIARMVEAPANLDEMQGERAGESREFSPIDEDGTDVPEPSKKSPKARSRKAKPDDEAREARALGYDIEAMNDEFALVMMGSKAVVFVDQPAAPIEDAKRIWALEAFHSYFSNKFTEILADDGKIKRVTWSKAWQTSKFRRSYRGVEFFPDPKNITNTKDYLNLWTGFTVEPKPWAGTAEYGPGKCPYAIFRDHLFSNVCGGKKDLFRWVFGFFAHMMQRPRERIGVALVMRGIMGSGKSKVGEAMGKLIAGHYFMVDDPRYVTGQFNAHMATCLLLQADEAVWAGDKAAEGRLKGLITSPIQQIEAKGVDPIRLKNYVRLIMTSNEDWVVPAGKDERRFCVLDIDPRCAQNHDYFREMDEELENGGYEALLGDLLAFDLESVPLRKIPMTEALLEQKLRSLNHVESWWYGLLMAGSTKRNACDWQRMVASVTLFEDYLTVSDKIGVKRKSEETVFGTAMKKLVSYTRAQRTVEVFDAKGTARLQKTWVWLLPNLNEAREQFDKLMHQPTEWPVIEVNDAGETGLEGYSDF